MELRNLYRKIVEEEDVSRRAFITATAGAAAGIAGCAEDPKVRQSPTPTESTPDSRAVESGSTSSSGVQEEASRAESQDTVEIYDPDFTRSDFEDLRDDLQQWEREIGNYRGSRKTSTPAGVIRERRDFADLWRRTGDKQDDDPWFTLDAADYDSGLLVTQEILLKYVDEDESGFDNVNPSDRRLRGTDRSFRYILPDEIDPPRFRKNARRFLDHNDLPSDRVDETAVQDFLGQMRSVQPFFQDQPNSGSGLDVPEDFVDEAEDDLEDLIGDIEALENDYRSLLDEVRGYHESRTSDIGDWLEELDEIRINEEFDTDTIPESAYDPEKYVRAGEDGVDLSKYAGRLEDTQGRINAFYDDVLETTAQLTVTRKVFEHARDELHKIRRYEDDRNHDDDDDDDNGDDDDNDDDGVGRETQTWLVTRQDILDIYWENPEERYDTSIEDMDYEHSRSRREDVFYDSIEDVDEIDHVDFDLLFDDDTDWPGDVFKGVIQAEVREDRESRNFDLDDAEVNWYWVRPNANETAERGSWMGYDDVRESYAEEMFDFHRLRQVDNDYVENNP